jgi:hypothetical protein
MSPTIQIPIPSKPALGTFQPTFQPPILIPIASKPALPLSLFSTPEHNLFKQWTPFALTFQLLIPSKPELPLSLLFNSRSQSLQTLNSLYTHFSTPDPDHSKTWITFSTPNPDPVRFETLLLKSFFPLQHFTHLLRKINFDRSNCICHS